MNILQVGKFYYPSRGGIETVVQNLSEKLAQTGHNVTVFCNAETDQKSDQKINNVRVKKFSNLGSFASQPLSFTMGQAILREGKNFDLVNIHSPNPFAETLVSFLPKKTPMVVTYHSDIVRQKFLKKLYRPIQTLFLKRADQIVATSQEMIEASDTISIFKNKCTVIPLGIDPNSFQLTDSIQKKSQALRKKGQKRLLFIGRLVPYKGLQFLIKAMRQVDALLTIIGNGPLEKELRELIRTERLENKVVLNGRIETREEQLAHLYACDVFVLPSLDRSEAFGVVLLEAMACHKPLLTTKVPSGVRLVNKNQETGLEVEPRSSEELSRALQKLLGNAETLASMGEASWRRLNEKFTLEKMTNSYIELYEKLRLNPRVTDASP